MLVLTNQRLALLDLDQSDALKGSASQVVCARRDKKVTVGSTEARTGFPFPAKTGFSLPVLKVAEGSDETRRRLSGGTRAVSAARGMSAWEYVNQRSVLYSVLANQRPMLRTDRHCDSLSSCCQKVSVSETCHC